MFLRRSACPVNYQFCNQTVTVYHKERDSITRTVYDRAFLDYKKTQSVDSAGSKEVNSFLLVIPGAAQAVFVGDKVYDGTGPEVTPEEWATFIPSRVPGVLVVSSADPKKWEGKIVHTEAGG